MHVTQDAYVVIDSDRAGTKNGVASRKPCRNSITGCMRASEDTKNDTQRCIKFKRCSVMAVYTAQLAKPEGFVRFVMQQALDLLKKKRCMERLGEKSLDIAGVSRLFLYRQ